VPQKLEMGVVHLFAALAAGCMIDRGRLTSLLPATWVLFAVAFTLMRSPSETAQVAGPLYAIGISLYSVALVSYPSRGASASSARWRAAVVYGVSGWLGSAFGVAAAQDARVIPLPAVAGAGALMMIALLLPSRWNRARPAFFPGLEAIAALVAVLGVLLSARAMPAHTPSFATEQRGRQVYIREGCINCHSQFIRPTTEDVLLWGPARPLDRMERPPLVGNRRQGPDLLNVGTRRNAEWQRLHLVDPPSVSPGSRMPAYAHLFAGGSADGDDLIAYLMSCGAHARTERAEAVQAWELSRPAGSPEAGRATFATYCTSCHGAGADGVNPWGLLPRYPAMNLRKGPWMFATAPDPDPQLARIVKFGLIGTPMPGHEWFSDQQVADVVAFLRTLTPAVAGGSGS
jgi:cytochrome c oxidase cbb3-type subunit 2